MASRASLRQALKASLFKSTKSPSTGHQIPEDFGASENPQDDVVPAQRSRSSHSRSRSQSKAANEATAVSSRNEATDQVTSTGKKRKASTQVDDPARSKAKRPRRPKEASPSVNFKNPAPCAGCRRRKTRCEHTLPAGEEPQSQNATRGSRKQAARRAKRVVAGQEELAEDQIEVVQVEGPNKPGLPFATFSSSSTSDPTSPPSDNLAPSTTPPPSVGASGDAPNEATAPVLPEQQQLTYAVIEDVSSSAASSELSSVPSSVVNPGTSNEALRDLQSDRSEIAATEVHEGVLIATVRDNRIEASSLTAKEKRAERARKGWLTRKQNAAKAAGAAEETPKRAPKRDALIRKAISGKQTKVVILPISAAASSTPRKPRESSKRQIMTTEGVLIATVRDNRTEASSLTSKEKMAERARKGWLTRKQKAAKGAAEQTPKRAPKRDAPIRKVISRKHTKVVTLPISEASSSTPRKPRKTSRSQTMTTPLPKKTHQQDGLLTPVSSEPERALPGQVLHADPALIQLSQKLTQREPLASKPKTQGQPLVWADSRQALCETVPYFKKPQGGCHQNDRHVYAFLLDGVGHCREYMDSDVIIARAGGHMEADASGKMVQKNNILMSEAQVQAVLNDIDLQNPLVIICGDRNEGAVCKMPHKYNVLGWYKPVAVWAERTLGKPGKIWTTIKYRFERLDDSKPAWHQPAQKLITDEDRRLAGDLAQTKRACPRCNQVFSEVYLCGWMCLNPDCNQFWRLETGQDAPYDKLLYNPAFLLDRTRWAKEEEPYSVRPLVPSVGNLVGDNLTYINTRGICCPQCGRCSSRRLFKGWRCDNPSCTFENFPQHIPVTPPMLHNPWENSGDGPALARNKHERPQGVKVEVSHVHGFKVFTYTFEGVNGKFVHAVSNAKINREPRGADEMFATMQRQGEPGIDMHLERRRFGVEKMPVTRIEVQSPMPAPAPATPATPLRQTISDTGLDISPLSALGPTPSAPDHRITGALARERHDQTKRSTQPMSDAAAGSMGNPEDTFLVGIEEAAGTGEAQPCASVETTTAIKPAVEDGDLMTAFSINYGMPYKFIAVGGSLPFTDSPWPVRTCRADLNWASQTFLDPTDHTEFNEELIFAYLEGQKIEYHDDGESGLGPRIATLSLGGKAKMHLRMKSKHYVGCSKQGIFTAERPMPHSIGGPEMYQKRLAAWNELQKLKTTDKPAYERRRKEIPKELGLDDKKTKKAEDLVTVTLNHGDIVLMEGYEIQQYLEHKVVPEQCLRFALTCRTVLPDHLKPEERPAYEVEPDDEGMSSLRAMVARERGE